jgi:hypothetical protein
MRPCKGCHRPLPDDSAPQRKYCEHPDCKLERARYRKAHERARAYNALTRITYEASEPYSKRKTSSTHDAAGHHEDDLHFDPGDGPTSRWDEISWVWQAAQTWRPSKLPPSRGLPALDEDGRRKGRLIEVGRLMDEAGSHPVGQISERSCSGGRNTRDPGCPGELSLKGKRLRPRVPPECRKCTGCPRCDDMLVDRDPEFSYELVGDLDAAEERAERETEYAEYRARSGNPGGHVWFSTKTPHGVAAMYAPTKAPAKKLGGPELFDSDDDDLTDDQLEIERLMQSNVGAF